MQRSSVTSVAAFAVLLAAISVVAVLGGAGFGASPVTDEIDAGKAASIDPDSAAPASTETGSSVLAAQPDFDRTTFNVTVAADGSARWTFEYERPLESAEAVEEFEAYAETFEAEETDLYAQFTQQAETLVATGERHTGREMSASDFTREATVEGTINRVGVVRMSFHWEGFAVVEDTTVTASDVFEGGFYIMSDQSLEFRAGEGLSFETVRPEAQYAGTLETAPSVTWSGERDFADRYPYVVFTIDAAAGASDDQTSVIPGWMRLVGGTMAVLLIVGGVTFLARRSETAPDPVAVVRSLTDGRPTGATTTEPDPAAGEVGDETAAENHPVDLVSDEDRVTALIEENGGRMKQVQIVEATDWSKSKVSMLLSEMESDGRISKLRVGRENIISLDGFEPEAARSPHDDE
ncbi:helix-turn-helix transcriptional regulator [Halovivax limisalsi]|uniref:helix-turn-helix transcriptional regulator n=1 Tax=Halovivax limisalsi TaxID=1453760 RepID=UPI001FFCD07D|nr:hypothetical protein [Halovivax limisalsi]